jgi:hypothetical protein
MLKLAICCVTLATCGCQQLSQADLDARPSDLVPLGSPQAMTDVSLPPLVETGLKTRMLIYVLEQPDGTAVTELHYSYSDAELAFSLFVPYQPGETVDFSSNGSLRIGPASPEETMPKALSGTMLAKELDGEVLLELKDVVIRGHEPVSSGYMRGTPIRQCEYWGIRPSRPGDPVSSNPPQATSVADPEWTSSFCAAHK